ncbi:MAG TPA: lysyl oxidase family protein [Actinomycetota bacterium]|jgi:hypothetical protein|nr:lysyl oxidase family protein [Actinomycetota bacterium]
MRRRIVGALLAVSLVGGFASSANAAAPSSGVLRSAKGYVQWAGEFADPAPSQAVSGVCGACDEFEVDVQLPASTWAKPGGGLQISIDWFPHEEQDLDLFVYDPDGALVGQSNAIVSTSEAVRINGARNGMYRVLVAPKMVEGTLRYRGLAEVEYAPAVKPLRDLLPNLKALKPRNVTTRTGAYYVDPGASIGVNGCYPEEMAEQGARLCLRFDQIVANVGEGPFELRYKMDGLLTDQNLVQRIYRSDGSFTERKADTYEFHPVHAHFHYKNFGQSHLYKANADGTRGKLVRSGKKNGFCMIDVENTKFGPGRKGEAPRTYTFPRCNAPTEASDGSLYMTNGISPGWADVYNWFLADQMIEISGIAPGVYVLETVADPAHTIRESRENDQAASILIRLNADGTAAILR